MLNVERLENRCLMSCDVGTRSSLVITGGFEDNLIVIADKGDGNLHIDCDGTIVDRTNVSSVTINTNFGNDSIFYYIDGDTAGKATRLNINGGGDNDTIDVDYSSWGNVSIDAMLTINLVGGTGDDNIYLSLGQINNRVSVVVNCGTGDDNFEGGLDGDLGGQSSLSVRALMLSGDDAASFNVINDNVLDALGRLDVIIDGGVGNDDLMVQMECQLDAKTSVRLLGGVGDDALNFDATIMANTTEANSLTVIETGSSGNDRMVAAVVDSALVGFIGSIDGGSGYDAVWAGDHDRQDNTLFRAVRSCEGLLSDYFVL